MKKAFLRLLFVICGLNFFTACYGMPPEDWIEPTPLPEEQEQPKASVPSDEDSNLKESDEIDISESVPVSET